MSTKYVQEGEHVSTTYVRKVIIRISIITQDIFIIQDILNLIMEFGPQQENYTESTIKLLHEPLNHITYLQLIYNCLATGQ